MTEVLFFLLVILNLTTWVSIFVRPKNLLEFPYLVSLAVSGFVIPQSGYLIFKNWMIGTSFSLFLLIVFFCQIFAFIGWSISRRKRKGGRYLTTPQQDVQAVANHRAILLTIFAVGIFFTAWLRTLPPSMLMQSQWSGLPVVLNFFAVAISYSFVLALALYLKTKRRMFLYVAMVAAVPLADRVFILFRREDVATVALSFLVSFYVYKRWVPPRVALFAALLLGVTLFNSAGEYRSSTFQYNETGRFVSFDNYFERVFSFGGIKKFFDTEDSGFDRFIAPEVMNAVIEIDGLRQSGDRIFGASIFNKVIQDFVPSSILGARIDKESLFLADGAGVKVISNVDRPTGSTSTGFSEIYANFDVLGVFAFFFISLFLSKLYRAATTGSALAVMWYVAAAVEGMKVVTHGLGNFASEIVYLAILTAPFFLFQRSQ